MAGGGPIPSGKGRTASPTCSLPDPGRALWVARRLPEWTTPTPAFCWPDTFKMSWKAIHRHAALPAACPHPTRSTFNKVVEGCFRRAFCNRLSSDSSSSLEETHVDPSNEQRKPGDAPSSQG